jgi:hypothetical protein
MVPVTHTSCKYKNGLTLELPGIRIQLTYILATGIIPKILQDFHKNGTGRIRKQLSLSQCNTIGKILNAVGGVGQSFVGNHF